MPFACGDQYFISGFVMHVMPRLIKNLLRIFGTGVYLAGAII